MDKKHIVTTEQVYVVSSDGEVKLYSEIEQLVVIAKKSAVLVKSSDNIKDLSRKLFCLLPREFQVVRDILREIIPGNISMARFIRLLDRHEGDLKPLLRRMEKIEL